MQFIVRHVIVLVLCTLIHCCYGVKGGAVRKACTLYNPDGTERPHRVVVFVDSVLTDVFLNWFLYYYTVCDGDTSHLDLICMDKRARLLLKAVNLSCSKKSFVLGDLE